MGLNKVIDEETLGKDSKKGGLTHNRVSKLIFPSQVLRKTNKTFDTTNVTQLKPTKCTIF